MNAGSQSKRTDSSVSRGSESGLKRMFSKEGFERMRSTRLDAVVGVRCQISHKRL